MNFRHITAAILLCILSMHLSAQNQRVPYGTASLDSTVRSIISDPSLSQANVSICVRNGNGEILVDINADKMMVPASNLKLVTTGTAMHYLGSKHRFHTDLSYDGRIENGVLHGNLYIVGGGDPTTASKDSIASEITRTFASWEKIIRDAGIRRIEGYLIGDGRYIEGMPEEGSWGYSDLGTYYGTGVTGLMYYENMQSFMVSPQPEGVGLPLDIKPHYPDAPWMDFSYNCTSGEAGTGDRLYMYTSPYAPKAEIRGTFAVDRKAKRLDCSNKFPEYTCAYHFSQWLLKRGISCSRGAADFRLKTEWMKDTGVPHQDSLKRIGRSESPQLKRIAFETNHISNNLYADAIFREIGRQLGKGSSFEDSRTALTDALERMGLDCSRSIFIKDGSGLSRHNLISPDFLCRFLEVMMQSPCFEDYVAGIPTPGKNGSLLYNMSSYPESLKNRIRAKSGSMTAIRCYSGYIIPTEGGRENTLIFSIMMNNCTAPDWKMKVLSDKIMAAIAAAN